MGYEFLSDRKTWSKKNDSIIESYFMNLVYEYKRDRVTNQKGLFGHKYIINTMVNESRMNDLYPTVLSFNPHPRKYFKKIHDEFNIILEKDKKEILNGLGVKNFLRLNFDKKTSSLTAEEFVKKFLVKNLKLKILINYLKMLQFWDSPI